MDGQSNPPNTQELTSDHLMKPDDKSKLKDSQMGLPGIRFGTVSPVADKIAEPVVSFPQHANQEGQQAVTAEPQYASRASTPAVPRSTTVSPVPSDSRRSWSELFVSKESKTASHACSPAKPSIKAPSVARPDVCPEELHFSWRTLKRRRIVSPHGLANYGNMCFLNAILQGLLYCSPLVNFFEAIQTRLDFLPAAEAPFLKALSELYQFSGEERVEGDFVLVPDALYDCLSLLASKRMFQGAQEDAQEFLTFLLDKLHEELISNKEVLRWRFSPAIEQSRDSGASSSGEWLEVGKRGVRLSRTMEHESSPISFLLFGRYRSVVARRKAKESVTLEPFHCVSLEIQDPAIASLTDALLYLSRPEQVDAGITKTVTLETTPPVLFIHLKRFVYDARYGVEKLDKFISYPLRLEIPSKVLHAETSKQRPHYQLHAVIYHHGRTADGGHYTCHVRQQQTSSPSKGEDGEVRDRWFYFDDASVAESSEERVVIEKGAWQNAYILMYICK